MRMMMKMMVEMMNRIMAEKESDRGGFSKNED